MNDDVASDRARAAAENERVKAQIGSDVEDAIADRAQIPTPDEPARIDHVAAQVRKRAVSDVAGAERRLGVARVLARVSQVIDFAFCVVYALLGLRFLLALLAARSTGFVRVLFAVTDPLYAPFRGVLRAGSIGDGSFAMSLIFAVVVYMLAHVAVHQLLHLIARPRTTI
jgi:uncharacterized protein YggT (Ycf19 family)